MLMTLLSSLAFLCIVATLPIAVKGGCSMRGAAILRLFVQIQFNITLSETVQETRLFRIRPRNENLTLRVISCLLCGYFEVSKVHFARYLSAGAHTVISVVFEE